MTLSIDSMRAHTPHLEHVATLDDVDDIARFTVHNDTLYVGGRRDEKHVLHVVDLRHPEHPAVVDVLPFRRRVGAVVVHDDLMVVAEQSRAVHFLDVTDPMAPKHIDCGVSLGIDVNAFDVVDGCVVAARDNGVSLMPLSSLDDARWTAHDGWSDRGCPEHLVAIGRRVFVGGSRSNVRVYDVIDQKLHHVVDLGGEAFCTRALDVVDEHVWVGCEPDGDETALAFIEPNTATLIDGFAAPLLQAGVFGIGGGCAFAFDDANGHVLDVERKQAVPLFSMFTDGAAYVEVALSADGGVPHDDTGRRECMDDVRFARMHNGLLLTTHGGQLHVFRPTPGSALAPVDTTRNRG